jgi:hypothetical protein
MLAAAPFSMAQPAATDLLTAIPSDALAAVAIRNVSELDGKVISLCQQLNLPPQSLLMLAKGAMQLEEGLNDKGGVAVVVLSLNNFTNPMEGAVVLVPCTDYATFTKNMGLQPAEGAEGVSKATISGEQSFIAQYGSFAAIAPGPDPLKLLAGAAGKPTIGKSWGAHELERFNADDLVIWFNAESLMAAPSVQGLFAMLSGMSQGQFNPQQFADVRTATIGLRIDKQGIRLGMFTGYKEGSAAATMAQSVKPTTESLLKGLPADPFVVAFGMLVSKESMADASQKVAAIFTNPAMTGQMPLPPEKLKEISDMLSQNLANVRGLSFAVSALPAGPEGLFGFTKVLTVESNAAAVCTSLKNVLDTVMAAVPAPATPEAPKVQDIIEYKVAAETLDGIKVDHLIIHLDKAPDMDAEQLGKVKKVVGEEGIVIRIGAIDDKHVVSSFGGGAARFQKAAALAKAGEAPLANDEAIKASAALLSNEKVAEGYFSLDHLVNQINESVKAVGEPEEFPYHLGDLKAPAAMTVKPIPPAGAQADLIVPMPLASAIKDLIMNAAAGGSPPPGGAPEGEPSDAQPKDAGSNG